MSSLQNPDHPAFDRGQLAAYLLAHSTTEHPQLLALREETARLPNCAWASAPEQAALLQLLAGLMGARRVVDIGTFTGYSALALALAMPAEGRVVTCDVVAGWSEMGVHYWRAAGVEKRIDRRIGRADTVLQGLIDEGADGFDLAFLDADKAGYPAYLPLVRRLLRPGGLLVADNVLWQGRVLDDKAVDADTDGIRHFNADLARDDGFRTVMLGISDGMTLAIRQ